MASTTASQKYFQTALVVVVVAVSAVTSACPPGWKEWNDSCYILLSSKMNYDDGVKACEQLGVNMIVPNTDSEYDYLWDEMTKWMILKGAVPSGDLQLWIGCKDVDNTRKMRCQGDQDNTVYPNWHDNEPNEAHDCIRMKGEYSGMLADRNCNSLFFVACETKVELYRPRIAPSSALYIHAPELCMLNHQIKSFIVKHPIGCGLTCWAEPHCHSFNLLKKLDGIICKHNDATRLEADVITDVTYMDTCFYYEPLTV